MTYLPTAFLKQYPKAVLHENDIVLSTVGSTPDVKNSAVGRACSNRAECLDGQFTHQNTVIC